MILVFDTKLSEKKHLNIALLNCFGVGKYSSTKILARFGYNFGSKESFAQAKKVKDIAYNVPLFFRKIFNGKKFGFNLKRIRILEMRRLNSMERKTLRAIRHSLFLPVRGQRTRKNAGTQKSKRKNKIKIKIVSRGRRKK